MTEREQYIADLEAKHGMSLEEYIRSLEEKLGMVRMIPRIKTLEPIQTSKPPAVRPEVVVAGVHEKFYEELMREFPRLQIRWVKPKDQLMQVKAKVLQKHAVIDLHGLVNMTVINAVEGFSRTCIKGRGLNFVKECLRQIGAQGAA